jgi:NTE family protein
MTERALVIGGGGIVGLAWALGWMDANVKYGPDLAEADRVIGTSAGALVGLTVGEADRRGLGRTLKLVPVGGPRVPFEELPEATRLFLTSADAEPTTVRAIGEAALRASTRSALEWKTMLRLAGGRRLGTWPDRLRIVVTDIEEGARRVLGPGDASLVDACAASAAVPGALPPIEIDGRMTMDGGIASGTNADLATGCSRVIVVPLYVPVAEGPFCGRPERIEEETAAIAAAGGATHVVVPRAMPEGGMMDRALVEPAYAAGFQQGKAEGEDLAAFWAG